MDLRQSETWSRHQLAAIERTQADVARYTHPVMRAAGLAGVAYLIGWVAMMIGPGAGLPAITLFIAATATMVVLGAPAFALAAGIECYFRRRLANVHAAMGTPSNIGADEAPL